MEISRCFPLISLVRTAGFSSGCIFHAKILHEKWHNPGLFLCFSAYGVERRIYADISSGAAQVIIGTHALLSDKVSFSNLGLVNAPEEYMEHVKRMDFVLGSQAAAPYNVSALTYGGKMYLNVTRNAVEPALEAKIYEVLREMGVPHSIESNTRERKG